MGYKPNKKIYDISFDDIPDLEITAIGTSIGKMIELGSLNVNMNEPNKVRDVFSFFSSRLVTWNVEHPDLEDESEEVCPSCGLTPGKPLPTTVEGMYCLDLSFIMKIFFGWMTAVARLPIPKEMNLQNGGSNQENLTKMLGNLQSPLTLQMPN